MKIGIDIDDTISNTCEKMFNYAQRFDIEELKREGNLKEESLGRCKTHMYVQEIHGWSEEEGKRFIEKYYKKTLLTVLPKLYAKEILEQLKKEGNTIYFITARFELEGMESAENITMEWLKQYEIPYDVLITDAQDKVKIAKENKIDLFIDDSYYHCKQMGEQGIKTFFMDSPMNNRLETPKGCERVYSWPQVYKKYQLLK